MVDVINYGGMDIKIVDRDYLIFREIYRWRVCLGRHVRELTGFTGQRACDIRLKKLLDAGYINRKRILYGIPGIYSLTHKAKVLINVSTRTDSLKIEQRVHDIGGLDTAIYIHKAYGIEYNAMTTEKQLHMLDGFSHRKHRADFVYANGENKVCVEIELSLKAKERLEKILKSNFFDYDTQIWIVPDSKCKIVNILQDSINSYPNIEIIELSEVKKYV